MGMRTKAYLIIVLILLLAGAGTLEILIKTGKLGSFAASSIKTVIVQGTYTNLQTGKPVVGATVVVNKTTTLTNNRGVYKVTLSLDTADPVQRIISIIQRAPGYPRDGQGTSYYLFVPDSNLSKITLTQNFNLGLIPQDAVSQTPLDPISQRCRTSSNTYDYSLMYYHTGDYKGLVIPEGNGVLFCAAVANQGFFTTYQADIIQNAVQINSLVTRTGLPYTPVIYLSGPITWGGSAAAYTEQGGQEIVVDVKYLNKIATITHEFGHLVDWTKGPDKPANDLSCNNKVNKTGTKSHCTLSLSGKDFIFSSSISGLSQHFITGYATWDYLEMFATLFESQQTPDSAGSDKFTLRQRTQYNLTNALLGNYQESLGSYSNIVLPTTPAGQNAAMYVYKFVASAGNLDEYFPGILGKDWSYSLLWDGKYMANGVVSVKLTECGKLKNGVNVSIGNAAVTTRTKQTSGVFPNGGGDLFDTTGTAVILNAPINNQIIAVSGYSSSAIEPKMINVIPGANPVIGIKINGLAFSSWNQFSTIGLSFDIAADPPSDNIFMILGTEILVYNKTGTLLYRFGFGTLSWPTDIAIDSAGNVYILDGGYPAAGRNILYAFKNDGTYRFKVDLDFFTPAGIAVDSNNQVYYLGGGKIAVYSGIGQLVKTISLPSNNYGSRLAIDKSGKIYVSASGGIQIFDAAGIFVKQINVAASSMAFDSNNNLYVALGSLKKVQVFDNYQNLVTEFNTNINAGAIDVAKDGKVYVGSANALLTLNPYAAVQIFTTSCL